jgi:hypothetical protein
MPDQSFYPYAPDQAFGRGIAANESLLDHLIECLDRVPLDAPRAGNKHAPLASGPSPLPLAAWLAVVVGRDEDGPITTAVALDAAARQYSEHP